jgi:hypothetical protein
MWIGWERRNAYRILMRKFIWKSEDMKGKLKVGLREEVREDEG